MLRGRRGTTTFVIGCLFLVLFSLWNAPGFQSIVPVSKSHVCVVGIVLMIRIILIHFVFKVMRKWLCSKVMHQTVFQSDPATFIFTRPIDVNLDLPFLYNPLNQNVKTI